MCPYMEFSLDF